MSKRLLFITCHRLDQNNGGANASKGFLRCMAPLFDECSIIYPEFDDTAGYIPPKFRRYPCHDSRPRWQKGLDMYRGVVGALFYCVRHHLSKHRYDIIIIDHSASATGLIPVLKATGALLVTIHHNVERDYLHDNSHERPISYRLPYNHFACKAERDCLTTSHVNLTLTAHDAATFASWYPRHNLHLHPLGIFEYRPIVNRTFTPKPKAGHSFAVTGSLCFIQSLVPITEFLHRYWPLIRHQYPDARLTIAGRDPSAALIAECRSHDDITIVPNPVDISACVSTADYYICPIHKGSGLKLRIMDALRQGLLVLCHEVSASGYECMAASGCLFTYHDESTFLASLQHMMNSHATPADVYRTFQDNYSTEVGTRRLQQILQEENII